MASVNFLVQHHLTNPCNIHPCLQFAAIVLEPETKFVITKIKKGKDSRGEKKIYIEVLEARFVGRAQVGITAEHYAHRYTEINDKKYTDSTNLLNKLSGISRSFYINASESLKNAFPESFDEIQKGLNSDSLLSDIKAMNGLGLSLEDVFTLYALCFDLGNDERSPLAKLNEILRKKDVNGLYEKAEFLLNALGSLRKLPQYKAANPLYIALSVENKVKLEKGKAFYLPEIAVGFEAPELARKMAKGPYVAIANICGDSSCYDVQMFTQLKNVKCK